MQKIKPISLNALRVFEVVVRHHSLKNAAEELCVSPSAVSHQIKALEQHLRIQLFQRGHNSIRLTHQAEQFFQEIQPSIVSIDQAVNRMTHQANNLVVRVGVSLAVRWLIPNLEMLKAKFPELRVRVETTHESEFDLRAGVDIALTYRADDSERSDGKLIMTESCQPFISPKLLARYDFDTHVNYRQIPAISSNTSNWDWQLWAKHMNIDLTAINIIDTFDTDDAAIHAAANGLGMVLASEFMAAKEIMAGQLVSLPCATPLRLGGYWLIASPYPTMASRQFESWVFTALKRAEMN